MKKQIILDEQDIKESTRMQSIYVGYMIEWCASMMRTQTLIICTALPRYLIS